MVVSELVERYHRLNRWLEGLSRARYALLIGSVHFLMRTLLEHRHEEQSFRQSVLTSGASALGSAAVYYLLDPRRPEFPTLYRRVTEGTWRG